MPYLNLDFAPGMFANGTLYQNRNLWHDGDRVRWHNGALRPIGGWARFETAGGPLDQVITSPSTEKARAIKGWRLNDGTAVFVAGSNNGLKAWTKGATTVYDITPVDFTPLAAGAVEQDGYGYWFYGADAYGTPRQFDEQTTPIFNWCFRNWGEHLLAAPRVASDTTKLYEWDTTLASPATVIAQAPTGFSCFHVTEERIVMVAGATLEPRLISWSDREDNTNWTPQLDNQAGSIHLPGVGRFLEMITVKDVILLISETDVHVGFYRGPPYIYGFEKIADDCGVISGSAVVATEDIAIWPGSRDFFLFDGSVKRLECPVMDRLQSLINNPNKGKMVGFVNPDWAEAWWLFQTGDTDVDTYIAYDWKENHWQTGSIDRTTGGVHPAISGPVMIGQDGYAYNHELDGVIPSDTEDATEIWIESGPIEIAKGNINTSYVKSILSDFIKSGEVDLYLYGRDRPNGPEIEYGPYRVAHPVNTNQPIPTRARGHTIRFRAQGVSSPFLMGSPRLEFIGGGRK